MTFDYKLFRLMTINYFCLITDHFDFDHYEISMVIRFWHFGSLIRKFKERSKIHWLLFAAFDFNILLSNKTLQFFLCRIKPFRFFSLFDLTIQLFFSVKKDPWMVILCPKNSSMVFHVKLDPWIAFPVKLTL